jgi:hypothetical protein
MRRSSKLPTDRGTIATSRPASRRRDDPAGIRSISVAKYGRRIHGPERAYVVLGVVLAGELEQQPPVDADGFVTRTVTWADLSECPVHPCREEFEAYYRWKLEWSRAGRVKGVITLIWPESCVEWALEDRWMLVSFVYLAFVSLLKLLIRGAGALMPRTSSCLCCVISPRSCVLRSSARSCV